jgi:hypothetical protein
MTMSMAGKDGIGAVAGGLGVGWCGDGGLNRSWLWG